MNSQMLFYTNIFTRGNYVLFRGFKDGKRINEKIAFQPSLFVRTGKPSEFKSLWGDGLEKVKFSSIKEARNFVDQYKDVSNFPIFGNKNYSYQFISKIFPDTIEFDMSLMKVVTIDIETTTDYGFPDPRTAQEQVILISIQDFNTKEITTFGCGPYLSKAPNSVYIQCKDEFDLLRRFINHHKADYPDISTGWNSQLFDIAYLSSRIEKVLGDRALNECSPWGYVRRYEVPTARGRTQLAFDWCGMSILDFMDLYKKFSFKMVENYKLDTVALEELGEQKLKNPYGTFKEFYTKDWEKFVDYNIRDVELVDKLEDKMRIINLMITMAYDAKCNFADIFSSVRTWDCILYNKLLENNIIVHNPPGVDPAMDRTIMGAYVKEPKPTRYDWVVSFDATSLYPSIIMSWNMSPETLVDGQKFLADDERSIQRLIDQDVNTSEIHKNDWSMTANGQCFTRKKRGIFPELIDFYFTSRQIAKNEMLAAQSKYEETKDKKYLGLISSLNSKQMAAKILMNSLYGALGNVHFRFYDIRIAEGITMTGQLLIRSVSKKLNEFVNKEVGTKDVDYSFYADTDSTYITLGALVEKNLKDKDKHAIVDVLDKYCATQIEPTINDACESLSDYLNTYQRRIKFKREIIADRGIWIAKKRYAVNVYNSEGVAYDPPKLKVLGMEIVRSSTPAPVRKALKEAVSIALTKDEATLRQFVADLEARWHSLEPEDIAFPRGVNGIKEYASKDNIFRKGTPIHVKGSLIYNHLIKMKKLESKYLPIGDGEKIKFCYLLDSSPLPTNVIAAPNKLPKELNMERYLDYTTQFDKSFVEPLRTILDAIGWKEGDDQMTLDSFF